MKLFIIASSLLMNSVLAADHTIRGLAKGAGEGKPVKPTKAPTLKKGTTSRPTTPMCIKTPSSGFDNSERLLVREGVISALPKSLCDPTRPGQKNVILVVVSEILCATLIHFSHITSNPPLLCECVIIREMVWVGKWYVDFMNYMRCPL
jgi:hypothetical protein